MAEMATVVVVTEATAIMMTEMAAAMMTVMAAMMAAVVTPVTAAVLNLSCGRARRAGDFAGHRHRRGFSATWGSQNHRAYQGDHDGEGLRHGGQGWVLHREVLRSVRCTYRRPLGADAVKRMFAGKGRVLRRD